MKIKKGDIKLLLFLVLYAVLIVAGVIIYKEMIRRKDLYIITNDYKIKRHDGKWKVITNSDDYKLRKFDIYQNGSYFGNYKILYSSHFTLIDDNDSIVNYDGILWGTSGYKNKFINYDVLYDKNMQDEQIISEALSMAGISTRSYYSINQKIYIDINNDGENETIYSIDNYGELSDEHNSVYQPLIPNEDGYNFSLLFIYKNNKIYIIDKNIGKDEVIDVFNVLNIIDIGEDGKYETVYSYGSKGNLSINCVKLFNLAKNKEIHNFCE